MSQRKVMLFKEGQFSDIPENYVTLNVSNSIDSTERIFLYTPPLEDNDIKKAKNNSNDFIFIPEDSLFLMIMLNNPIKEESLDSS